MKLERKYARRCLGLAVGALLCAILTLCTAGRGGTLYNASGIAFFLLALLAVYERFAHLRCPNCGKGVAIPHWNAQTERQRCRKCGRPFIFDDELKK